MSSVSRALAETEANPRAPSYGLYRVWEVSQLTPDEPVCNDDAQWLIPILEALTAVGHTESRANACFGLRGLANWGASAAAAALRRVIVREESIVTLVAGWFGRTAGLDWNSLAAEDCARVLLLLALTHGDELLKDLLTRLPPAFRVVALPGIVVQVTQPALDQLGSVARVEEAQARFEGLCQNGSATDWEIYFRDFNAFVGLDRPYARYDHVPLPDRVDTYLLLVSEFARVELERGSNMTWRMLYELAILRPLAILSFQGLYRERAMTAYNAVLNAMEAPVRQDLLEVRRNQPVRTRREMQQAARLFLIEALRQGPYFEQKEDWINVSLTSSEDQIELSNRAHEIELNLEEDDTDTMHDSWTDVDLY